MLPLVVCYVIGLLFAITGLLVVLTRDGSSAQFVGWFGYAIGELTLVFASVMLWFDAFYIHIITGKG